MSEVAQSLDGEPSNGVSAFNPGGVNLEGLVPPGNPPPPTAVRTHLCPADPRLALHPEHALDHQADIAKVQEWLSHANIATTRIYDHRKTRPEDRPTFKAKLT